MYDPKALVGVFGLSAAKFMMGVALGASLRLPFVPQVLCTGGGGVAGVLLTAYAGDGIRAFVRKRFPKKPLAEALPGEAPSKESLAVRVWNRWGLAGLAVIGTVTLGPVVAVVTALSLGAARPKVIGAMTAAVLVWAVVFGVLSVTAPGLLPAKPS